MCGRYGFIPKSKKDFEDRFAVEPVKFAIKPHYNVAPGQIMPVVIRQSPNQAQLMKWGLVPYWAKDVSIGYKMINARAESITTKPSFRKAFAKQRCLVPASGFFEWQKTTAAKQPYFIKFTNDEMLAFAGIFDVSTDAEGKELRTFSIITTQANRTLKPIHNRMPVILNKKDESDWLDQNTPVSILKQLLRPFPDDQLIAYEVSPLVNNPENDTRDILQPQKQVSLL